jgi:2-deoxy-D-gluconate 3-dehydrogenase
MAAGLLRAGADVAIISSSNAIFGAADMLGQTAGRPVHALQADLSDRTELQQAFEHGVKQLGGLDVLVVNHAIQRRFPAEEFPIEDWDVILETNLTSMFLLNQLAGRVMLSRGQGKIINVASLLSFSGGITVPAYAATKGGVAQLTKALANEWAGQGVNVNAIAPGYMDTDSTAALLADPVRNRDITKRIPAGRWGQPEDLQGIVIFLASEASAYIHGAVIPVDGGWLAR